MIYIYIKNQKQKQCEICSVNDSFHEVSRTLKNKTTQKNQAKQSLGFVFFQFGLNPVRQSSLYGLHSGVYVQPSTTTRKTRHQLG